MAKPVATPRVDEGSIEHRFSATSARLDAVQRQIREAQVLTDRAIEHDRAHDPVAVLRAQADLPDLRLQELRLSADVEELRRMLVDLKAKRHDERRAYFGRLKAAAVAKHRADVERAIASGTELQQLQTAEHDELGSYLDPLWLVAADERTAHWRRSLAAYGFASDAEN